MAFASRQARGLRWGNRWSCGKLLRGECEGRVCATLTPDICLQAQRSYDECTKTRFVVDLSGARSRRWKSEVLSIMPINRRLHGPNKPSGGHRSRPTSGAVVAIGR